MINENYLLNKKMLVDIRDAYDIETVLLSVDEFGYDFVLKKSKVRKKFSSNAIYVAFFINEFGGIDHFDIHSDDYDDAMFEFNVEPEDEIDYEWLL